MTSNNNCIIEKRFDGKVELEISTNVVKIFKINCDKLTPKQKESLLREFKGRLLIDFRKDSGGVLTMNDIVCVLPDEVDFETFKLTMFATHERLRGGEVKQSAENKNQYELLAENRGIRVSVLFWSDKRKFMAQGHPEQLAYFLKCYTSVINSVNERELMTRKELKLSQTPSVIPSSTAAVATATETFATQELSTPPISAPEATLFTQEIDRLSQTDPEISRPDDYLKESVFVEFQQNVMRNLPDLQETLKSVLVSMPSLKDITDRITQIDQDQKKENAEQNSRIIILEDEVEKLAKSMEGLKEQNRKTKATFNHTAADIGRVRDEISNARAEIECAAPEEIKAIRESVGNLTEVLNNQKEEFDERFLRLEAFMTSTAKDSKQRPAAGKENLLSTANPNIQLRVDSNTAAGRSVSALSPGDKDAPQPSTSPRMAQQARVGGLVLDAEVIIFIDSNGKYMEADIMDKNTSVTKVMCYTLSEAVEIIKSATFLRPPRKILFHCGTNDIENSNPHEVAESMDNLLYETRTRLTTTQLFVSAIMRRRDHMDKVVETNDLFQDIISKYYASFLNHKYVRDNMLADKKHLNNQGFYQMLAYYRFILFGTWPRLFFQAR